MTGLTLGYMYGYAEARGNRSLWRDQVQLAEQINTICRRRPNTLLKDIAWEILRKKGIISEPTNGQR
jgi:hypothetical protein